MTTITLTDAAGTPVNHPFSLVSYDPQAGSNWMDLTYNSGGYPVGAGRLFLREWTNDNGTTKLEGKLVLPTLETPSADGTSLGFSAAPTKAYDCIATFEMVFPGRCTLQNRKDLNAMFKDLLSDAVITSAVESLVRPT